MGFLFCRYFGCFIWKLCNGVEGVFIMWTPLYLYTCSSACLTPINNIHEKCTFTIVCSHIEAKRSFFTHYHRTTAVSHVFYIFWKHTHFFFRITNFLRNREWKLCAHCLCVSNKRLDIYLTYSRSARFFDLESISYVVHIDTYQIYLSHFILNQILSQVLYTLTHMHTGELHGLAMKYIGSHCERLCLNIHLSRI